MQDSVRQYKASIFQALANPTRIAIVELLRDEGEIPVTRIQDALLIEQANASQHLSVLRTRNIVLSRKQGNQVFYTLRDNLIGEVLDLMKKFIQLHLGDTKRLLKELSPSREKQRR